MRGQRLQTGTKDMKNLSFNDFVNTCKTIATNLDTMVEIKEYSNYGWGQVSFMTDKFGGTYVCLHFDMKTGKVINWFGHKDAREINDLSFLSYFVKNEMEKMLKARNLKEIYNQINNEY